MFVVNEDMSIYVTRGDIVYFNVSAGEDGKRHQFQVGDIVRIKVYGKKDASTVVLQKDFPVSEITEQVEIYLTEKETKIGDVISKPKDYWYEIELNPYDNPQTLVGYDEDGAKVFRLLPEGRDLTEEEPDIQPEDIPIVDEELDMTSLRPVQNQAIARKLANLEDWYERTHAAVAKLHVTPQMFGAIADGVSDDTEAIQAAIDSGAVVVFPKGAYAFSGSLSLSGKTNFQMDAKDATLKYTGTDFAMVVESVQEATLNLGRIIAPNGSAIKFQSRSDEGFTQYVDVYFRSITAARYGVYADITGGWVNEVRFHNGIFSCEYGCYLNPTAEDECTGWKFFNVSFEGSDTGLYLGGNDCRFRDIELHSIRYGDDTSMVVVHVANQIHNLKLIASMPFYDSYFVVDSGVMVYNSEINAPIYNTNHVLVCRQRYYDASGVSHDVGFIKRATQEMFNDCVHAEVTKHANVTLSDTYCAYNAVTSVFQTKVTCNKAVPAWNAVVTLPKAAMRVVGSCVHTYVPALGDFVQLYVNTDGTITTAVELPANAKFVIHFAAIRNQ